MVLLYMLNLIIGVPSEFYFFVLLFKTKEMKNSNNGVKIISHINSRLCSMIIKNQKIKSKTQHYLKVIER